MATIHILIILAVFVGIIFLQIFLSKKENRLLGLILPIITFLYSLLTLLNVAALPSMTAWEVFGVLAATFILSNIPTLVLLAVYCACKGNSKRKNQLEKMNIQDLD
ncbi:MAG: hypothetical protein RR606_00955 [Oscillospiraceae bacterium]